MWYSNGQKLWDASGTLSGSTLSTGNENTRDNGSSVQGILTVRHPLNPNVYHVFCADDVLSTLNLGLDYYTLDSPGQILSGPTTILAGRTFEGMNATWHANGVDIWVMSQSYPSGDYEAFLISCAGLDPSPVRSSVGIDFNNNLPSARGAIEFSSSSLVMAQGHPASWPVGDQEASIFDFDNLTGVLSNPKHLSSTLTIDEIYDIEFSPDDSKLYVTTKFGVVAYYDLNAGNTAAISGSFTTVTTLGDAAGGDEASIEMGGDGRMYVNNISEASLHSLSGSVNGGATGSNSIAMPSSLDVTLGLPNMFIPPRDWLKIKDTTSINECDLPYDFSTNWICKKSTAENTQLHEDAYTILEKPLGAVASIDSKTGNFTTNMAGAY